MTKQLVLIDTHPDWKLDEKTRRVGYAGIAQARETLAASLRARSGAPPEAGASPAAAPVVAGVTAAVVAAAVVDAVASSDVLADAAVPADADVTPHPSAERARRQLTLPGAEATSPARRGRRSAA
jgi:hypothetical protein